MLLLLLAASSLVHACGFATTVYTILVFNNYLPYGVTGTLVALSIFAALAVFGEFHLRGERHRLVVKALVSPTRPVIEIFLSRLSKARFDAFDNTSWTLRRSWIDAFTRLTNLNVRGLSETLLDLPFAILFLVALFFLHPVLGLISLIAVGVTWTYAKWASQNLPQTQLKVLDAQHRLSTLAEEALLSPEVLRAQRVHRQLPENLSEHLIQLHQCTDNLDAQLQKLGHLNQLTMATQTVLITAIGSVLVFRGELSLGALIGSNLLAARALAPLSKFILATDQFYKLESAVMLFQRLAATPEATDRTSTLASRNPELSAERVTFRFPGRPTDVFEPVSFELKGPEIVVITGPNGSGKTTLLQLLTGYRIPTEGRILLQGVELQQLSGAWWESQFGYVPQDDRLLNGTLYSALTHGLPKVDNALLNDVLTQVALKSWIDQLPEGLAKPLSNFGEELPPGIRRKILIARGLITNTPILLLDEPTQSLDQQGRLGLLNALNKRFQAGTTLIICSDDPEIVRGATLLVNLTNRVNPTVTKRHYETSASPQPRS